MDGTLTALDCGLLCVVIDHFLRSGPNVLVYDEEERLASMKDFFKGHAINADEEEEW